LIKIFSSKIPPFENIGIFYFQASKPEKQFKVIIITY